MLTSLKLYLFSNKWSLSRFFMHCKKWYRACTLKRSHLQMILWIILLKDPNGKMTQLSQTGKTGIRMHFVMATKLPFVWSVNDNFTGELGHFSQAERNQTDILIYRLQLSYAVLCNTTGRCHAIGVASNHLKKKKITLLCSAIALNTSWCLNWLGLLPHFYSTD